MALTNAERQKRYREKKRKSNQRCIYCDGWIWGEIPLQLGFHKKCNAAAYMREYRKLKKQEGENDESCSV